jgi:hypothetical protein
VKIDRKVMKVNVWDHILNGTFASAWIGVDSRVASYSVFTADTIALQPFKVKRRWTRASEIPTNHASRLLEDRNEVYGKAGNLANCF